MANVAENVKRIRQAVYGKEVRESIAAGIEAINNEVMDNTSRQDTVDSNETIRIQNEDLRVKNEQIRIENENKRYATFEENERNRIATFEHNESARINDAKIRKEEFESNETYRRETFDINEQNRINTFEHNEKSRQQDMNTFMKWYNDHQISQRLPLTINCGDFGDPYDGIELDGGDFGDGN